MAPFKTFHFVILAAALFVYCVMQITSNRLDSQSISDLVTQAATKLPGHQANPDIDRTIHQIIESRRFLAESHYVTTSDDYILNLIRIKNPFLKDRSKKVKQPPVLLMHGFQCSGSLWIVASNGSLMSDGSYFEYDDQGKPVNGSDTVGNSLGFVLASRGYDVWIANYRGSIYSSNHTYLSIEDAQFWSFSMDEMVQYDLTAIIDYIVEQTNSPSLAYIGHSQGTFLMFSLLSRSDKYNNIITPFIALSPVVFTKKMQTPARHFQVFKSALRSNPSSFFHNHQWRIAYSQLCSNKFLSNICFSVYSFFLGSNREDLNLERLSVYLSNIPVGSSSRNAAHFFQMFSNGGLPTQFDFGDPSANMAVYGTETPPLYNMSNIKSDKIALIYVKDDWFNSLEDIRHLKKQLNVQLFDDYEVPESTMNHMELVWSKKTGKYVNTRILEILSQF